MSNSTCRASSTSATGAACTPRPDVRAQNASGRNCPAHGAHSTGMSRSVMFCHVLHAPGTYSVVRSGMVTQPFQAEAPGIPRGARPCLSSAWIPPLDPVSLPPPACGGSLFCAFRVCGRAGPRARIAAARFARVIARARRRTHLARRLPPGLFCGPSRSPAQKSRKAAPGAASLLSFYHTSPQVKSPMENYFRNL